LIRSILSFSKVFDELEFYYRTCYSDIDRAIRSGSLRNGIHHYLSYGEKENHHFTYKVPLRDIVVIHEKGSNTNNYSKRVSSMLKNNRIKDWSRYIKLLIETLENNIPLERAEASAYARDTTEYLYLRKYPDVSQAIKKWSVTSGLEHYLKYGAKESKECALMNLDIIWPQGVFKSKIKIFTAKIDNMLDSFINKIVYKILIQTNLLV